LAVVIHGIKACDTMKKARDWLEGHGVAYAFHDYKTQGIGAEVLKRWAGQVGWEVLLNRSGTTFRGLPDADKAGLDETKAIRLMAAQPSMIKRPVLDVDGKLTVGFRPEAYDSLFRGGEAPTARRS
jgi:Spx/MgsR family transcriptional regulator